MPVRGEVTELNRSLPTVQLEDGRTLLCEHAASLSKAGSGANASQRADTSQRASTNQRTGAISRTGTGQQSSANQQSNTGQQSRAVIGDLVEVTIPEGHDVGIITKILPRRTQLIRKDPTERTLPQVLAANFDQIMIVQPIVQLNLRRLERELVLAHQSGAKVAVLLTKADLAKNAKKMRNANDAKKTPNAKKSSNAKEMQNAKKPNDAKETQNADNASNAEKAHDTTEAQNVENNTIQERVCNLAGADVAVLTISAEDAASIDKVRRLIPAGSTTVLMGSSGVGKSTLVNALFGADIQKTAAVREVDGRGRHTTVNRQIIELPGGARIIDMPGVRGLGLWDSDAGIDTAFADVEALAEKCRFRDCTHTSEPGCAVLEAVNSGKLSQDRYDSYIGLRQEAAATEKRRQQSHWKNRRGR